MEERRKAAALPLNILLELIDKNDKTMSISELCKRLNIDTEELIKMLRSLSDKGLVMLNTETKHVRLTGLGLLYLRDLKELLKS